MFGDATKNIVLSQYSIFVMDPTLINSWPRVSKLYYKLFITEKLTGFCRNLYIQDWPRPVFKNSGKPPSRVTCEFDQE